MDKVKSSSVPTSPAPESTKSVPAIWMPLAVFLGLALWQRGIFWKCYFVTFSLMAPVRAFSWIRSKVLLFRHHLHQNPPQLFQQFGCLSQSFLVLQVGRGDFFGSLTLSHLPWWHLTIFNLEGQYSHKILITSKWSHQKCFCTLETFCSLGFSYRSSGHPFPLLRQIWSNDPADFEQTSVELAEALRPYLVLLDQKNHCTREQQKE